MASPQSGREAPRLRSLHARALPIVLVLLGVAEVRSDEPGPAKLSFNRDVRAILSDNCFQCHGPDDQKRQAGLRLDQRGSALGAADSGQAAIVPGEPAKSGLIDRVTHADPELRMPPAGSGKQLTPAQIETLRKWVEQGAEYQGHWAFETPVRPTLPENAPPEVTGDWQRNPIDRLVLARMRTAGLSPSPEADKRTLIRRVTLDLTGLPPTPAEVEAFLADESPEAYDRLVDRLLMSPHYGERMALPWLDFARYADSNGFQSDGSRDIWGWRDWVIGAYNRNLPFDQFTIEQLAGDLLPNPTRDQVVATGFNRNHRLNGEGGRIVEEWFVETVIDRVETTGLTWLGLTLGCCRCHDHKYDPVTQREFYQLFAFFNSVDESGVLSPQGKNGENTPPLLALTSPEQEQEQARLDHDAELAEARVKELQGKVPELLAAWEQELRRDLENQQPMWRPLAPDSVVSTGGAEFQRLEDGSYLASGANPAHDTYVVTAPIAPGPLTGLLLECLADPSLPNESVGRYSNGNYVLTRVEAELTVGGESRPAAFSRIEASYSQQGWEIKLLNNGDASKGWAVDGPSRRETNKALLVLAEPWDVPAGATLTVRLHHEALNQHNIGRFRLSVSSLAPETLGLDGAGLPDDVRAALLAVGDQRQPAQQQRLEKFFRESPSSPLKGAEAAAKQARERATDYRDRLPTTMVMREVAPRDAFVLTRGEYDRPGEKVGRALPSVLPPLPAGAPLDRLGLARWIVDPSNPLTARVWVNRAWERFFGVGIVRTTENFGSQAEYPSHPELLDWLACEFMAPTVLPPVDGVAPRPWDMKAFQKLIVTSATYRQSSHVPPRARELDPDNRLLSHAPRIRLAGEMIRDQALAVSGLLVPRIGGPSVRPYMPEGVWDETSKYGNLRNYKHDQGEGLYRRTMYTIWKRTAAPPTMLLFDAPNREVCVVKRSRTNTPLQALSLLNEVTFVEAARKLGERMVLEGGETLEERLAYGFRLTLAREPEGAELALLADGLRADLERFRAAPAEAERLTHVGDSPSDSRIAPAELAAYSLAANVLLNLDEFVTRE